MLSAKSAECVIGWFAAAKCCTLISSLQLCSSLYFAGGPEILIKLDLFWLTQNRRCGDWESVILPGSSQDLNRSSHNRPGHGEEGDNNRSEKDEIDCEDVVCVARISG